MTTAEIVRKNMDISIATERSIWTACDKGFITTATAWYWVGQLRRAT